MNPAQAIQTEDRVGWLAISWRLYLLCLGTSFFVLTEPAPTDALFVLAFAAILLARLRMVPIVGPVEVVAILIYLWFTLLSLSFDSILLPFTAVRAAGIEIYLILLFLMTAYFVRTGGDRAFRIIMITLVVAGLITSAIGVMAYLGLLPDNISGIFFRDEYRARVRSTFKDPNVLGPFLVPPALFMLWVTITSAKWRIWAGMAFVVMLFCLVVTFSRGAWVHMLGTAAIFIGFLLAYRATARPALITVVGGIVSVLVIAVLFDEQITRSVSDSYFGKRLSLQSYDEDRFATIGNSFEWMIEGPLGVGPNQVKQHFGKYPHNTFATLALNNGIPATLGFAVLFFAAMVRCGLKVRERQDGWMKYAFLLSILAGLLVLMNVVGALHWRHLYVVMGLAYGTYRSNSPL